MGLTHEIEEKDKDFERSISIRLKSSLIKKIEVIAQKESKDGITIKFATMARQLLFEAVKARENE